MKVYLICDESGAKGYSDVSEKCSGETGVFAGYLVNENHLEKVKKEIDTIASRHFQNSKYHITSLADDKKEKLRNDVFGFLKHNNLACVYEAIHVEGFKTEYELLKKIKDTAKETTKSDIKVSGRINLERLHEELFQGLFTKALAYCIDTFGNDYQLVILVDKVDKQIFKNFTKKTNVVTDFSPSETEVTGYDKRNQKVINSSIKITINVPESYGMSDIENASFELIIDEENNSLMLAADVLGNSIDYIFKSRSEKEIGKPLNDKTAIKSHLLTDQFYGLPDETEQAWISDIIYMHPKESERQGIANN